MDDRLVLQHAGGGSASHEGGAAREPEENEDEKVYYGFGVFMGLPLADLKAMKEDLMQRQQALTSRNGNGDGDGAAAGGFGHSAFETRGTAVPPVALANGRSHPLAPPLAAHHALYSSSSSSNRSGGGRAPPRALGREYDASHGVDDEEEAAGSDAGSDGSYSAPKSHSLNFILH